MAETTLLILGASGDLTSRLLLPGLATLLAVEPSREVRVVGSDLEEIGAEEWRELVRTAFDAGVPGSTEDGSDRTALDRALETTGYTAGDATDAASLQRLIDSLDLGDEQRLVIYFALPPHITARVCEALVDVDLPERTVLAAEKPFGTDGGKARELNRLLTRIVPEEQVFRIDHFLGLYTVLNLLGLRFANRVFERVWDRTSIERVEIFYDETVTLEGRAGYYDQAGALRDMIQSHLLQVMALLAIDQPTSVEERDLRDAVGQVLRAARVADPVRHSRRARYTAGSIGDREVPDYTSEEGVDPARGTETLAEVQVEIANHRWAGVPFVLRSGKSFGQGQKQAVVHFRSPAHVPEGLQGRNTPDTLTIDFKPDTFTLRVTTNGRGDPFTLEQSELTGELGGGQLEPYGEVLSSMLDGDLRLAVRGDAAEECWRIVTPVLEAWARDEVPMDTYAAGSRGPEHWETTAE
ncbi:glucose-6-phosphate dehydrogenase [Zhihengliuella sp.]|uniref:glucose-6-phosphate dehydrogenase n=1 Tax=Zhihengliuella sp. TaxID=1954483 RepID=UPI00281144D8|nr:glucose-6-phosphate dehydrogenase [Zhihengliuella sp.]